MGNIESTEQILVAKPFATDTSLSGAINKLADLMDTLHVANVFQSLFDLVQDKSEILSIVTRTASSRSMGIRWRHFP